jgi:hypothetical protein
VLGGGQFGQRAVDLLRKDVPAVDLVVIDRQPLSDLPAGVKCIRADGVAWLVEHFVRQSRVGKIIPAIPKHLAAEWLKRKLAEEGGDVREVDIPDDLLQRFPHAMRLSPSQIVMSHADFICPPNCAEPDELCSVTRRPRPTPLHYLLETMNCGSFTPLIIRSRQFAAGVGGFFPEDLWQLLARARSLPGTPLLVGSACKCHGIVDGFCHQPA